MKPRQRSGSLRVRLLVITLVTVLAALSAAYWWLSGRFSAELQRQLDTTLAQQIDQVTARLDFNEAGEPLIDTRRLSDPRWERPYSGLYWQLDRLAADGNRRDALLRSRSLWDAQLGPIRAVTPAEDLHAHDVDGPRGERLRVLERSIRIAGPLPAEWRLLVAADSRDTLAALRDFDGVLLASLGGWVRCCAWRHLLRWGWGSRLSERYMRRYSACEPALRRAWKDDSRARFSRWSMT